MERKTTTLENLFDHVEQYGKTSFELYKHKAIYETAKLTSTLATRLILTIVVVLISLFASIGLALWLGDLLHKTYYGFFIVALLYALVWVILFLYKKSCLQTPMKNMVIKNMMETDNPS